MMSRSKLKLICSAFVCCLSAVIYAQNDTYFDRLQAVVNSTAIFYNVDGIEITSQSFSSKFNEKELKKVLRAYKIKRKDVKTIDPELPINHYVYDKSELIADNLTLHTIYYILDFKTKVKVISFSYAKDRNLKFERQFIADVMDNAIPSDVFVSSSVDSLDFAGRTLVLGGNCRWMNVRNVQCPYYGQMNWSLHKTIEDAKQNCDTHLLITKHKKGGKVISETSVPVVFEGKETTAKSVTYDFTGVKSLLVGMSGGKTLTIYYIAEEIRGRNISCVLSFWNNDQINDSGLPALLEEVMTLKN
ncbi:hypothetical protein [Psychroserpens algicola]|uniref:Uncharacterized protein n=1 Tax=Psychroserpens algicola TaxID=1719034 RepID=A0ABT0HCN4_9FLAO|nr:hypothetical protein [Psychroserpens algicola]MCK8482129.1 hypothetical protein [Psychroserpens algicola]